MTAAKSPSSDSAGPNIVAFVFARGGSKGVPRKNLRPLGGISLLARAIRCAKAVPGISRVVVSTDDPEIADAGRAEGAEVPFLRPPELASDTAREWQAWRHAVDFIESQPNAKPIDIFVSVPAVVPLRNEQDVARAIALYRKGNADIVFSVTPSSANPYYNMVELDPSGTASLSKRPEGILHGRQKAPTVYDLVAGVYVTSPAYIRASESIWGGRNATIEIPRERAVDIDTEMDFRLAEFLLQGGTRP
jgi:CMP-N-acetylneuraminic acid synthetase